MKPSQLVSTLRRIASNIERSKNPDRGLVAKDLKKTVAILLDNFIPNLNKKYHYTSGFDFKIGTSSYEGSFNKLYKQDNSTIIEFDTEVIDDLTYDTHVVRGSFDLRDPSHVDITYHENTGSVLSNDDGELIGNETVRDVIPAALKHVLDKMGFTFDGVCDVPILEENYHP